MLAWRQGDFEAAAAQLDQSRLSWATMNNRGALAWSLGYLANLAGDQGDGGRAIAQYEEALTLFRELDDEQGISFVLTNLGVQSHLQGDLDRAAALYAEELDLARRRGDQGGVIVCLGNLGDVALERGRGTEAEALFRESLAAARAVGDRPSCLQGLEGVARTAAVTGIRPERTARIFGSVEAYRDFIGVPVPPPERADRDSAVAAARLALGETAFAAAWAAGRALPLEDVIAEALAPSSDETSAMANGLTERR
jgi:tetratricopeptide (TPR) repeat protein